MKEMSHDRENNKTLASHGKTYLEKCEDGMRTCVECFIFTLLRKNVHRAQVPDLGM